MRGSNQAEMSSSSKLARWRVEAQTEGRLESGSGQCDAIEGLRDCRNLCGLPLARLATETTSSAKRTSPDTSRDAIDDFKLLFQVSGCSTIDQNGLTSKLCPGDVGILDLMRPVEVRHDGAGRVIGVQLPRQQLISHLGFEPRGGLCWKGEDTLAARLLIRLIDETIADEEGPPASAQTFVRLAIFDLVGALFGGTEIPRHFSQADKLFLRVCHMIKREFSNPDVGPTDVAVEAGISVRYLQKIFFMRGTTYGKFLKSLRLDHAATLLARRNESQVRPPLVEIAWACGYRDYAHFARNFRARFGHTPGSVRRAVT